MANLAALLPNNSVHQNGDTYGCLAALDEVFRANW